MIRVAITSDLHLEVAPIELRNLDSADVLVLAGDILCAHDLHKHPKPDVPYTEAQRSGLGSRQRAALRYREFLAQVSEEFPEVIYVAGNHEFYDGKWMESLTDLRRECAAFPNISFLENDTKVIEDVTFMGATLWTDCNQGDPLTLHCLKDMMNDYRLIRNDSMGYTSLRPAHTLSRHTKSLQYFKTVVQEKHDQKFVMVSHHAPTKLSVHPRYKTDILMNGGYSSDLSEFFLDRPQIKLAIHGHTHDPFDYVMGDTRVICNPRGYMGLERLATDFTLKVVEI